MSDFHLISRQKHKGCAFIFLTEALGTFLDLAEMRFLTSAAVVSVLVDKYITLRHRKYDIISIMMSLLC